jgi:CDP-glucose 4,6-dehydratase
MGTIKVLEAVRASPSVRVVVAVTSDKCYANPWRHRPDGGTGTEPAPRPFVEIDPKGGSDPYSSSKACAELVVESYLQSFFAMSSDGPRLASGRAGNVIGGGDWGEDRLIPDIMRGAITGEAITVHSPQAVRPWQHVLSPLSGYLRLADWGLDEALSSIVAWYLALRDGADMRAVTLGHRAVRLRASGTGG